MNLRGIKTAGILIAFLLTILSDNVCAIVVQNASSALRSDNFISSDNSDLKKQRIEQEKRRLEAQKKQEKELREAQKRLELQQKLNAIKQLEQADCPNSQIQINRGSETIDTYTKQNIENKKREVEEEIRKINTNSAKDTSYTKSYASKLFQTYSGHITIEQKNIPTKIAVTKGSTLQLNMENKPESFWYVVSDDKIAKVKSNTTDGNITKIIFEAIGKGSTKLILDNISTQNNTHRVLTTKRMRLIVDDAK